MPKNNCIQCKSNAKYKIVGKNDSECIYTEYEDCQNAKAGYDQNATSVADLLFSQGVSDEYEESDFGPFDGDTIEESEGGSTGIEDSDFDGCEDNEVYSYVLKKCVNDKDMTLELCIQGSVNTDPTDTSFTTFDVYSIQQQKCVTCQIGQVWVEDTQQCMWINDEHDDLPDFLPCTNMDCGKEGGRCEEGQCICDDGYANEDEDDRTTPCVKVADPDGIDPNSVNTFDLEDEYKINNNIEHSAVALMLSFNPTHNSNWKGHINKDLPVWVPAQVQSGAKLPEDLKFKGGPLKTYAGKVPPAKYVNPILNEILCSGKTTGNEKSHRDFGTWVGADLSSGKDLDAKTGQKVKFRNRKNHHYGKDGRRWFASSFPKQGGPVNKNVKADWDDDESTPKTKKTLDGSYRSGRWGYCYVNDLEGTHVQTKRLQAWVFCASGLAYTFDLFRMKYHAHLNTNKVSGGNKVFKGDVASAGIVAINAIGGKGTTTQYERVELDNYFMFDKSDMEGGKKRAKLANTTRNIRVLSKKLATWKGAIFSYYGHVGLVLHIENPSSPAKAKIWTFEMNTGMDDQGHNGGVLAFKRRPLKDHKKWNFAGLDHVFGGSWAPKGLGNMEYLKDLFGVAGNPDFDTNGELSTETIKGYFTG